MWTAAGRLVIRLQSQLSLMNWLDATVTMAVIACYNWLQCGFLACSEE
jgi:hypothetical protein